MIHLVSLRRFGLVHSRTGLIGDVYGKSLRNRPRWGNFAGVSSAQGVVECGALAFKLQVAEQNAFGSKVALAEISRNRQRLGNFAGSQGVAKCGAAALKLQVAKQNDFGTKIALAAVVLGLVGVASLTSSVRCDGIDNAALKVLKQRLVTRLEPIREKKRSAPSVKLMMDEDGTKECRRISFLIPTPIHLLAAVNGFSKDLKGQLLVTSKGDGDFIASFQDGMGQIVITDEGNGSFRFVLFREDGKFSDHDLDCFVNAYEHGAFSVSGSRVFLPFVDRGSDAMFPKRREDPAESGGDPYEKLESLGAIVYKQKTNEVPLTWESLAGYEDTVRQEVEDTVLLALKHPDEYESVTRQTRKRFESSRPRAILFDGPPGTGKTTTARIIANLAGVPMIYVPIESIMSKWYGESEANLAEILKICDSLGTAIIFLDEIDSLATSRDSDMHEATRRVLSVLLRTLEGFEGNSKTIVVAATNRKQDLDAALISRFDITVSFPLPDAKARKEIYGCYAKHLTEAELKRLGDISTKLSGRDIKDVCKHAERRWVSHCLRSRETSSSLEIGPPPIDFYIHAVEQRKVQMS